MLGGSTKIFTIRVAPLNILLEEDTLKFNITVTRYIIIIIIKPNFINSTNSSS